MYITDVPSSMDLSKTFDNGGITINATLQPQYFLGGTIPSDDPNDPAQDTSIKIPQYKIENNKLSRWFVKPINTAAINRTPSYKAEVQAHVAGLFAVASGDISVLSGYANKNLKISDNKKKVRCPSSSLELDIAYKIELDQLKQRRGL